MIEKLDPARVVVIGVGHPYRGDDGVGIAVVRAVKLRMPDTVKAIEFHGDAAGLIDSWSGTQLAILVDAMSSNAPPGTIVRIDTEKETLPAGAFRSSTHVLSIPEAVELARILDQLPKRLIILGIEGANFDAGERLTPSVEAAVEPAANRILQEIAEV